MMAALDTAMRGYGPARTERKSGVPRARPLVGLGREADQGPTPRRFGLTRPRACVYLVGKPPAAWAISRELRMASRRGADRIGRQVTPTP